MTFADYTEHVQEYSSKRGVFMVCKTMVLPYQPRAAKMAAAIEEKANEMAREG